jgi:hypothetical protein
VTNKISFKKIVRGPKEKRFCWTPLCGRVVKVEYSCPSACCGGTLGEWRYIFTHY